MRRWLVGLLLAVVPTAVVRADAPSARTGHMIAPMPDGNALLFGGTDQDGNLLDDTWFYDAIDRLWEQIPAEEAPSARYGHSMADLPDGRVLLFGGETADGVLSNELYVFQDAGWSQVLPSNDPPPARKDHAMWRSGPDVYVLGGAAAAEALRDLWAYRVDSTSWERLEDADQPVAGAAVGTSEYEAYVLGYSGASILAYSYAMGTWTSFPTAFPAPRSSAASQPYLFDDRVQFFGGLALTEERDDGEILGDAWAFDLADFAMEYVQLADLPSPVAGAAASLVGTGSEQNVLLFGGQGADGALLDSTWAYDPGQDSWEEDVADDDAAAADDDGADDGGGCSVAKDAAPDQAASSAMVLAALLVVMRLSPSRRAA